ncbi:DUF475 domain-containing protein [Novosphingobium sp.]|uniref:DUF475 domain-containing protein n=1 Tax=Novosphingobium sp. TaxID=1874826 RepID=UPI0025D9176E|nr:DUF475 domain-containing protein [Novosphingobium sp.]MCC6926714.1 DUF475 domain-containing protein [Novosphingobium sp.]
MMKYFRGSMLFTVAGLGVGAWLGYMNGGTMGAALATMWICLVLSVLEVSLSFDNAVVNATVLKDMDPVWQRRFLTWGILIAVFGMRIIFPLLIVAIAASLGPIEALRLAIEEPLRYQHIIEGAHAGIMGFGGAFLLLVGLKFFFDSEKEHDWIGLIERPLKKFADLEAFEIILTIMILYFISNQVADPAEGRTFLVSGLMGIATFFAVEWIGNVLEAPDAADGVQRAGLGAFLYLEVLDASFSFDGVIGAFALSNNLFVIAVGLGIGAMFVRSLTIFLVDKGTLAEYRYLEHGAFWAIIALAMIMLTSLMFHIPETVTGLIGAALIGLSLMSSIKHNRAEAAAGDN